MKKKKKKNKKKTFTSIHIHRSGCKLSIIIGLWSAKIEFNQKLHRSIYKNLFTKQKKLITCVCVCVCVYKIHFADYLRIDTDETRVIRKLSVFILNIRYIHTSCYQNIPGFEKPTEVESSTEFYHKHLWALHVLIHNRTIQETLDSWY